MSAGSRKFHTRQPRTFRKHPDDGYEWAVTEANFACFARHHTGGAEAKAEKEVKKEVIDMVNNCAANTFTDFDHESGSSKSQTSITKSITRVKKAGPCWEKVKEVRARACGTRARLLAFCVVPVAFTLIALASPSLSLSLSRARRRKTRSMTNTSVYGFYTRTVPSCATGRL